MPCACLCLINMDSQGSDNNASVQKGRTGAVSTFLSCKNIHQ
uniref:Uncharacterized protein n=1 Tax=Rhizophora mucronata TaxID=61149 RepID=A0A2P2QBT8_RHIMU